MSTQQAVPSPSDPDQPMGDAAGATFTIPVLSETATVEKVLEHTGTVRVRKVVHEDPHAVPTGTYREVVETERVPVNRPVSQTQSPRQEDDVLVIPVYEERVFKQLFLLEELHVKRRREAMPGGDVHLRREEVIVERLDPATQQWVADRGES
ncbi:MAG: hypothetical protein JWQ72_1594 [Polaromonas sp.]|nr:hypothetical protein [Polaromonas sp.]